jgi:hypothetical protein
MRFADWLLNPRRDPATQKAWCKEVGITESTASGWRQHPDVLQKLSAWREAYTPAFAEVVHSLHRKAVGGGAASVQAARLLAELLGQNEPRAADASVTELGRNGLGQNKDLLANLPRPTTSSPRGLPH